MDIDALRAARVSNWQRLHDLANTRRPNGAEIDELAALYRQGTTDLASIRTLNPDADLIRQLSADLARARARLTGVTTPTHKAIGRWFWLSAPSALYQIRWWSLGVTVGFLIVALLQGLWLLLNPDLFAHLGTRQELTDFAHKDFVTYYSQDTPTEFGLSVWFNNAFIALQCVGGGITGLFPLYVLYQNALSLGLTGAVVVQYGGLWHLLRFILPHGLPELTAIFIAGAAGLRVFWALIVPGPITRFRAVAQTGRTMVTVASALVILLFISGILEGFVTPSALPDVVKIGLGATVTTLWWVYTLVVGGAAWRSGHAGDLETDAGYDHATAG